MNYSVCIGLLACTLAAAPAAAFPVAPGCPLNDNATVSISFNGVAASVGALKDKIDAKSRDMDAIAKPLDLTKFELQSMNYNVSPGNESSGDVDVTTSNAQVAPGPHISYNYSGSITYTILPSSKAIDLLTALNAKGYRASVNVNSYRNGNCN